MINFMIFNAVYGLAPCSQSKKNYNLTVLLIDMQPRLLSLVREKEKLIENQIEIIRWCAKEDIPLVVLEFEGAGETIDVLRKEIEKVPRVKTIQKKHDDGFTSQKLEKQLKIFDSKTLLLMGINADYCVKETAIGAMKKGFVIATSNALISGWRVHSSDNSLPFYKENGIVFPDRHSIFNFAA